MKVVKFNEDLEKGHRAELLVQKVFSQLTGEYVFDLVSDQPAFYHLGDIRAIGKDGKEHMIEVKNDCRIGETKNILCEEEVWYYSIDSNVKGFMHNNYEYYCVVSEPEHKIYVIDFKVLFSIYRKGEFKALNHYDQMSYAYLVPLGLVKKYGGLIAVIDYEEN